MVDSQVEASHSRIPPGSRGTTSQHKALSQMNAQDLRAGGKPLVKGFKWVNKNSSTDTHSPSLQHLHGLKPIYPYSLLSRTSLYSCKRLISKTATHFLSSETVQYKFFNSYFVSPQHITIAQKQYLNKDFCGRTVSHLGTSISRDIRAWIKLNPN